MTPGIIFVGTDPENELAPGVPVDAAPAELEPGIVGAGVCARAIGEQDHRTPTSRIVQPDL